MAGIVVALRSPGAAVWGYGTLVFDAEGAVKITRTRMDGTDERSQLAVVDPV
jgi:hypothetical protein